MDTTSNVSSDSQPDALPPSATQAPASKPSDVEPVWPYLIVPSIVWLLVSAFICSLLAPALPLLLAIPAGLLLGLLATGFLITLAVSANGSTLLEVNITLLIYLVLGALLLPVFLQARERARQKVFEVQKASAPPIRSTVHP